MNEAQRKGPGVIRYIQQLPLFICAIAGLSTFRLCAQPVLEGLTLDPQQKHIEEQQRRWAIERVEAGYISNFPYYVQWPDDVFMTHPYTLYFGFLGPDTMGTAGRQYLSQHGYLDRSYVLEDVEEKDYSTQSLSGYQMLYIGGLPEDEVKHITSLIADKPVLTMSHDKGFLANGGIIQLSVTMEAVTFEVDLDNAKKAGLTIDQRLTTYGQIMSQPWQNQ